MIWVRFDEQRPPQPIDRTFRANPSECSRLLGAVKQIERD
jgi:hypothetical protein